MAERIAQFDWKSTPLGEMSSWPETLKNAVDICLNSPLPMFVWWGRELINIYNDAYAPLLGGRHPASLGAPARKVWAPVWHMLEEDVDSILCGAPAVLREKVRFVLKRRGLPDEMFFTYTFSPISQGRSGVDGVMQVAIDQTATIIAERARREAHKREERRLRQAKTDVEVSLARWLAVISNMREGVILADAEGNLLDWNRAALDIHGYTRPDQARTHLTNIANTFRLTLPNGSHIPFSQWPMSRILRGERIVDLEATMHQHASGIDHVLVYNGTLIRDQQGDPQLALLSLHDITEERKDKPTRKTVARGRMAETAKQRAERTATETASAAEALLHHMNLTKQERAFCLHLGQSLVEEALDSYLTTVRNGKGWDGSCIAASLAIALIIVHDL